MYSIDVTVEPPAADLKPIIKEAMVFKTYNLFDKAIAKIKSVPSWDTDYEAIDFLIEVLIDKGEQDEAKDLLFKLLTLALEKQDIEKAAEIFEDIKAFVGEDDPRIIEFQNLFFEDNGQEEVGDSSAADCGVQTTSE